MTKSKDSSLQIAGIVVGLLVVVGGAWLFLNSGDAAEVNVAKQASTSSIQQKRSEIKTTSETVMPVDTSLQMAEMAFQSGELVGDEEGSALYFYREVLKQDPENTRALTGLELINTQLVDEAKDMLNKRNFEGVSQRIKYLNEIEEGSDDVLVFEAALDEEGRVLFASLEAAIEGNSFDQAQEIAETLRQIPSVDSGRVNASVVSLAKKRKEYEDLQLAAEAEAEAVAEAVQAVQVAQAEEAAAIEQAALLAEQERVKEEMMQLKAMELLLAKAKTRIDENRLFSPSGDSAVDVYKEVLVTNPDNSEAKRGLRGLVQKMTSRAYEAAEDSNWKAADKALEDAEMAGIAANLIEQAREEVLRKRVEVETNKVVSISEFEIEKSVTPVYPSRAAARSIEGWVKIEFIVSDTGVTKDLKIMEPSERAARSFRDAAKDAVEQWRFKPRMIEGQAVAQRSQTTVQFRLAD